jgi:hypothetical protein
LVASAEAKLSYAVLICEANMFFFCARGAKKNGEHFLNVMRRVIKTQIAT